MTLQLYHRWQCPYSKRVRDYIDEHRLNDRIEFIELGEAPDAEDRLDDLTGRSQVPCLVIDGEPMLESGDIVQWLQTNLTDRGKGTPA
ncbi:MAG TPA: glutaredoxin [Microvirga sp.]